MQQVNVKFNDVEQIRQFIKTIDKFDTNFDLGSGHRVVDAKSIIGVMAVDFLGPLQLRYHSDDADIRAPPITSRKVARLFCIRER